MWGSKLRAGTHSENKEHEGQERCHPGWHAVFNFEWVADRCIVQLKGPVPVVASTPHSHAQAVLKYSLYACMVVQNTSKAHRMHPLPCMHAHRTMEPLREVMASSGMTARRTVRMMVAHCWHASTYPMLMLQILHDLCDLGVGSLLEKARYMLQLGKFATCRLLSDGNERHTIANS